MTSQDFLGLPRKPGRRGQRGEGGEPSGKQMLSPWVPSGPGVHNSKRTAWAIRASESLKIQEAHRKQTQQQL